MRGQSEVSFMPLDMPEAPMTLSTLAACQKRCAEQPGCCLAMFVVRLMVMADVVMPCSSCSVVPVQSDI